MVPAQAGAAFRHRPIPRPQRWPALPRRSAISRDALNANRPVRSALACEDARCSHAATRPAARASSDLLVRIVAAGALRPPPGVTQAACSADRACSHRAGQEARRSSPRGEGVGQRQPRHSHLPRPSRRPIPARNSEAAACPDPAARYRPPAIMSRPPVLSACSRDPVPDEATPDRRSDTPTTRARSPWPFRSSLRQQRGSSRCGPPWPPPEASTDRDCPWSGRSRRAAQRATVRPAARR